MFMFLALTGFALCFFSTDVMGQAGSAGEVDQLIKDLQNESWQIRWDAAAALGETKDPRAIDPLGKALQDEIIARESHCRF